MTYELRSFPADLVVQAAGWALLHFVWQGGAIATVLAPLLAATRRALPAARYAMSVGALAAMAAVPVATFATLLAREAKPPAASREHSAAPDLPRPFVAERPDSKAVAAGDVGVSAVTPATPRPLVASPSLPAPSVEDWLLPAMPWLVAGWLAGAAVLWLRLAGGWCRLRAMRGQVEALPDEWAARLARLAERLGVRTRVGLWVAADVQAPCTLGWFRPAILVPAAVLTWLSPDQVEAVLAHELAHVRRRDYLVNLLQTATEAALFYHPAVWWASTQVRREREHCCDDAAADACGSRPMYARAITNLEAWRSAPALAVASNGASLLARVRRLASPPALPAPRVRQWPAGVLTLAAALTVTVAASCQRPLRPPLHTPASGEPLAPATAVTRPATTLSTFFAGRVLTPAGEPAGAATVTAYRPQHGDPWHRVGTATTGTDGRFAFRSDCPPAKLVVTRAGSPWTVIHVRDGTSVSDVRMSVPAELRVNFVDPAGKPVPGVVVRLDVSRSEGPGLPTEVTDRLMWTADAQGGCRLDRLPLGYTVAFDVADQRFAHLPPSAGRTTLAKTVNTAEAVRLWPAGSIAGRVLWTDGSAAAGARVEALSLVDGASYGDDVVADASGGYRLDRMPAGTYDVRATASSAAMEPSILATRRVTLAVPAQDQTRQDVTVARGATILGKVTDAVTGRPARADVTARPIGPGGPPYTVRSGAEGEYAIRVPAGAYRVGYDTVSLSAAYEVPDPPVRDVSVVEGGTRTVDLALKPLAHPPLPDVLTGRVLDEDGNPVAGALVTHNAVPSVAGAPPASATENTVFTDAAGRFSMTGIFGRQLLRAAERTQRASTPTPISAAGGDDVTLRVKRGAWAVLKGRVTRTGGLPFDACLISTYTLREVSPGVAVPRFGTGWETAKTDRDGRFSLPIVFPEMRSRLLVGGKTIDPGELRTGQVVELPDALLTMNPRGSVAGSVVDARGNAVRDAEVGASWLFGESRTTSDEKGEFRLDNLGEPEVELWARYRGKGDTHLRVKAGTADNVLTIPVNGSPAPRRVDF